MFELIARLDHEQYQYEFPVKCLPVSRAFLVVYPGQCRINSQPFFYNKPPSQAALAQGLIPPFYQKKINLLLLEMSQGTMDHIQLCILDNQKSYCFPKLHKILLIDFFVFIICINLLYPRKEGSDFVLHMFSRQW